MKKSFKKSKSVSKTKTGTFKDTLFVDKSRQTASTDVSI